MVETKFNQPPSDAESPVVLVNVNSIEFEDSLSLRNKLADLSSQLVQEVQNVKMFLGVSQILHVRRIRPIQIVESAADYLSSVVINSYVGAVILNRIFNKVLKTFMTFLGSES